MFDTNGDGKLAAFCQPDQLGAVTGSICTKDSDCRNGTCAINRCTEVCNETSDCPFDLACVTIPRVLPNSTPTFTGCFQAAGNLSMEVPITNNPQTIKVPIPSNATSFAVIVQSDDEINRVGVIQVISPTGQELYAPTNSPAEIYRNPLRYEPAVRISTLLIPSSAKVSAVSDLAVQQGVYTIAVGSSLGSVVSSVTIVYKLDLAGTLDLNLYFLDSTDHLCKVIDADSAQASNDFQVRYLGRLRQIFSGVLAIGEISYQNLGAPKLDGIDETSLPELLELSDKDNGINIFFVRSISPPGIQALAGGRPGPPNISGTPASGIAISLETLCYRDWNVVARTTAHEIGRHLGLFRNKQPDPAGQGQPDTIPDSNPDSSNLMYFGELGGIVLSEGQKKVLRLYPGLR